MFGYYKLMLLEGNNLLCTLPSQMLGIAKGNEGMRLGRMHLYFCRFLTNYSFVGC